MVQVVKDDKNSIHSHIRKTIPAGQSIRILTENKSAYLKTVFGKQKRIASESIHNEKVLICFLDQ